MNSGVLERIWQGIYCRGEPDDSIRLRGLDYACGTDGPGLSRDCGGTSWLRHRRACRSPRAQSGRLSIALSRWACRAPPRRCTVSPSRRSVSATSPAWTAVEVARSLRRPRALATLDAALRSGTCQRVGLRRAAAQQAGRRGIVAVRDLIPLADGMAESPMESEARLAMIDGGLPRPVLQYEIIDGNGELRRVDFAWPEERVAAEYDGIDWHSGPEAMRRDRRRQAALQDVRVDCHSDRFRGRQVPGVGFRCPHRPAASPRSRRVSDPKCQQSAACRVQTRSLAAGSEREGRYVPGPMLRAGRVRRSCTYSAGAPAISAASAITPR